MRKYYPRQLRIGEVAFLKDGTKLECVRSNDIVNDCIDNCYFNHESMVSCRKREHTFSCIPSKRPDLQTVYFKKIN